MAVTTVAQFAAELNKPAGTLLEQLQAAGVKKSSVDDALSELSHAFALLTARLIGDTRKKEDRA